VTGPGCVVCVPARNEAAAIPALIAALGRQALAEPLRVVVVANNCTDGTAAILRELVGGEARLALRVIEVALPPGHAIVGVARGLAMDAGAAWLREEGMMEGVLVSTDADSVPPPGWIGAICSAVAAGAEAVGGEIRVAEDPAHPAPPWLRGTLDRVARYWAAVRALAHRLDPVPHDPPPRHGGHTGASLAVTLAAYEAAGGVPPLASDEDNALVAAIERGGGRLRHAPEVWTTVSAREDGRASGGMAEELRMWRRLAETGAPLCLPDAAHWEAVFRRRRVLRNALGGDIDAAARRTGADPTVLRAIAWESVNDIAFVARAEPVLPALVACREEITAATLALEGMTGEFSCPAVRAGRGESAPA